MEAVSDFIVTAPYGGVEQDDFLNGAMRIRTLLTPFELLDRLHEIEAEADRKRVIRWGPQTLDPGLILLLYDDEILDTPQLHIPHIEMHKRDFVLKPLAQIAPWVRHPIYKKIRGGTAGKICDSARRMSARAGTAAALRAHHHENQETALLRFPVFFIFHFKYSVFNSLFFPLLSMYFMLSIGG